MSDVERIVNANHERVRWAAEYEGERIAASPAGPRRDEGNGLPRACGPRNDKRFSWCQRGGQGSGRPTEGERRKAYRSTALGCAMFTGGASAFVGIGLSMGRWLTVAVGLLVSALFLACGAWAERLAEGADA